MCSESVRTFPFLVFPINASSHFTTSLCSAICPCFSCSGSQIVPCAISLKKTRTPAQLYSVSPDVFNDKNVLCCCCCCFLRTVDKRVMVAHVRSNSTAYDVSRGAFQDCEFTRWCYSKNSSFLFLDLERSATVLIFFACARTLPVAFVFSRHP